MSCYAVIDTNVLLSALLSKKPDSATVQVMDAVFDGRIVPLWHKDILAEYEDVLSREKFHLSPATIKGVLRHIERYGISLSPQPSGVEFIDPDDVIFYEVVMAKRSEDEAWLVTGNLRHFPAKSFIVTPAEMMEILNNGQ